MSVKSGIIGHAIGDAMGVPIEFSDRDKLLNNPITTMTGYGSYDVPAGSWSDDTSMELATIDSIINKGKIDCEDIMMNFYYWLKDAKYTPYNEVFDAGRTCIQSIINFSNGYKLEDCGQRSFDSNGNGSLMRMLPIAYYCYYKHFNVDKIYKIVKDVSSLTHAHEISILGCYIYVNYVIELLNGADKMDAYNNIKRIDYSMFKEENINVYSRILKDNIKELSVRNIKSSGYVVDSLEASLWVLLNASDFKESIIGAINLGGDTDTIGAITGSMAGFIYGFDSIPKDWVNTLARKDYLFEMCDNFEKVLQQKNS